MTENLANYVLSLLHPTQAEKEKLAWARWYGHKSNKERWIEQQEALEDNK